VFRHAVFTVQLFSSELASTVRRLNVLISFELSSLCFHSYLTSYPGMYDIKCFKVRLEYVFCFFEIPAVCVCVCVCVCV